MIRGLLLDVGGVVIRTPFELLDAVEDRHGLQRGALGPRGPFELDADPEFRQVVRGELAERAYWQRRAERAADLLDVEPQTRALMRVVFDLPEDEIVRPSARALVAEARAAGLVVGALTNDLHDFHGREWIERMTVFDELDVLVDGSRTGVLKPDPRAYEIAAERMGLPPDELLLVDDQAVNASGAEAAGIRCVHLDPFEPAAAFATARELLGLPDA